MASTDATVMPPMGQAFEESAVIIDTATGNPLTGGLTGISGSISKDGGSFNALTTTPTEIGTTGYLTYSLSAAETLCNRCIVRITASNSGAKEFKDRITFADLDDFVGRFDDQPVVRVEQLLRDLHSFLLNRNDWTGAEHKVYTADGSVKLTATGVEGDLTGQRDKLE